MSDGASAGDGNSLASDGGRSDAAHPDVSLEIDVDGVELKSVIVPQDSPARRLERLGAPSLCRA